MTAYYTTTDNGRRSSSLELSAHFVAAPSLLHTVQAVLPCANLHRRSHGK
jgi:hypothetical protein